MVIIIIINPCTRIMNYRYYLRSYKQYQCFSVEANRCSRGSIFWFNWGESESGGKQISFFLRDNTSNKMRLHCRCLEICDILNKIGLIRLTPGWKNYQKKKLRNMLWWPHMHPNRNLSRTKSLHVGYFTYFRGALSVTIIFIKNRIGDSRSSPGRRCLHFTLF